MERVAPNLEKKLPDLNFKMKLFINFSISSDKELSIAFSRLCGNYDETKSKKLRKIIFKMLGVKDQKGFEKMMVEEISYVRTKIKDKLKEKQHFKGNDWFSKTLCLEIEKEIKRVDEKKKK